MAGHRRRRRQQEVAGLQGAIQVLRRLVAAQPGATGPVRRQVQVPEREHGGCRRQARAQQLPHVFRCGAVGLQAQRGRVGDRLGLHEAGARAGQVRRRGRAPARLRTGQGRGQEHPAGRRVHRAGHAAVRRLRQRVHHARPGHDQQQLQPAQPGQPEPDEQSRLGDLPAPRGRHGQHRSLLALRRRGTHRARLEQPVSAGRPGRAVRGCQAQPVRPQGSAGRRPVGCAGQVLHVQLYPHRRPLHGHDHQRLRVGVRPVLAAVRREVRPAQPAGRHP